MPTISMFYGLIVRMYAFDNIRHKAAHIHVHFQDQSAIIEIPSGELLDGDLPGSKLKLIKAWVELHKDELIADWQLAIQGEAVFKIDPLK